MSIVIIMYSSTSQSKTTSKSAVGKRGQDTLKDSDKKMFVLGMYEIYLKGSKAKKTNKSNRR